ncbi:unnamed protein product, partial [Acanthoscelides obtectus]
WCVNGYCVDVGTGENDGNPSAGEHRHPRARIPIVLNPQDGGWGTWQDPSYGGKSCEGEQEEWRTCNVDPCTDALVDLRAQQCKQLPQALHFEEKPDDNFTWLPYESEAGEYYIGISKRTNTQRSSLLAGGIEKG